MTYDPNVCMQCGKAPRVTNCFMCESCEKGAALGSGCAMVVRALFFAAILAAALKFVFA